MAHAWQLCRYGTECKWEECTRSRKCTGYNSSAIFRSQDRAGHTKRPFSPPCRPAIAHEPANRGRIWCKNRQILHTHKIREYRNRCTDGTDPRRISGLDIETIHAILLPPKERRTNRQRKRGFRLYGYEVQPWSGREVVWSRWGTDTYTR